MMGKCIVYVYESFSEGGVSQCVKQLHLQNTSKYCRWLSWEI